MLNKLAKLLVNYSLKVEPNDIVSIQGTTLAEPLIKELYKEILIKGAHPQLYLNIEGQSYLFYKYANEQQLKFISPNAYTKAENINCGIYIDSEFNSKDLVNIDGNKMALTAKQSQPLRDIYNKREQEGLYTWVVCPYPTLSAAQDAEMSLDEYSEFVYGACGLNPEDPTKYWENNSL